MENPFKKFIESMSSDQWSGFKEAYKSEPQPQGQPSEQSQKQESCSDFDKNLGMGDYAVMAPGGLLFTFLISIEGQAVFFKPSPVNAGGIRLTYEEMVRQCTQGDGYPFYTADPFLFIGFIAALFKELEALKKQVQDGKQ